MPWLETDVRDQRIQFVITVRRGAVSMTEACRAFGISRKTGYKWLQREKAARSVAALANRSRRPHRCPTRTSTRITRRIGALRAQFGWGGQKLATLLGDEGIRITARTIDRIIQREGWTRSDVAPSPALQRFTREAPNDLWQMDAKGAYPLADGGRCHTLSVIDDHSRFAVGLRALTTLDTASVQRALTQVFEIYGVPGALLMDHGTPWWTASGAGVTTLGVFLLKQGVRLIFSAIRHPQTQGKVERFHRTLGERLRWVGVPTTLSGFSHAFTWFQEEYNERRPHAALQMQPPARHYQRSRQAYAPTPRPWVYPPGLQIRRVTAAGLITLDGVQYFISGALQGEDVACLPYEQRLLVQFRHMYVRELHPRSRESRSLMQPMKKLCTEAGLTETVLPMS